MTTPSHISMKLHINLFCVGTTVTMVTVDDCYLTTVVPLLQDSLSREDTLLEERTQFLGSKWHGYM